MANIKNHKRKSNDEFCRLLKKIKLLNNIKIKKE